MSTEDATKSVVENSAESLVQLSINVGKYLWSAVDYKKQAARACRSYYEKYVGRHGQIRVLGMASPLPLRELYTEVQCISAKALKKWATPEQMQQMFLEAGIRAISGTQSEQRFNGINIANETHYLNVLGAPGSGKSTFLRYVGLKCLERSDPEKAGPRVQSTSKGEYYPRLIPVLVELRRFRHEPIDLHRLISNEFVSCGFPSEFAPRALENGRLLVLLDGLDEVPMDKLDPAISHIGDFVSRYDLCHYITSCRTAFYKTWFTRFTDIVLADFSDTQIENFIANWFGHPRGQGVHTASALSQQLSLELHAATRELSRTPLLAAFICLVFEQAGRLPENRAELYGDALRILMERWAAERRVHLEPVFEGLYGKGEILLLEGIAGPAYESGRFFFSARELAEEIESYLKGRLNAPVNVDGEKVLNEIETRQGILVERAHDVFSFSHLTIQEFLAASYFYKGGRLHEIVGSRSSDPKWREILLLLAGLCEPNADAMLLAMCAATNNYSAEPSRGLLRRLLHWAASIASPGESSDAGLANRTAALLVLALVVVKDGDRELSNSIKNCGHIIHLLRPEVTFSNVPRLSFIQDTAQGYSFKSFIALARSLFQAYREHEIFEESAIERIQQTLDTLGTPEVTEYDQKRELSRATRRRLLEACNFPDPDHEWTDSEFQLLDTYLEGAVRVLECSRAALRVTQAAWQNVASGLITSKV